MRRATAGLAWTGMALALAMPARAAVTEEAAAALQRDLRGWVAGLLAPLVAPESVPLRVLAAGDAYRLEVTAIALSQVNITYDTPVTAAIRPLDGGRWAIEDYRMPAMISVALPQGGAKLFSMAIGQQQARGVFDPSYRTASRFEAKLANIVEEFAGPSGPSTTRIGAFDYSTTWEPAGEGYIDTADRMRMTGYAATQVMPDGQEMRITAREIDATTKGVGINPANAAATVRSLALLAGDLMARPDGVKGDNPEGPTPGQRQLLHAVLDSMTAVFVRLETEQTWSGLTVAGGAGGGQLDRVSLASRMAAPGGKAEFGLRLEFSGLQSALIPQGPIRQLIPRRIAVAPRLTGVAKSEVLAFLGRAIDVAGHDDADLQGEAQELLSANPATIALDDLDIDLGIARLRGAGELKIAAADDIGGTAELRMTGLDALLRTLRQVPEAAAAAPVLLMLKGLGEVSGNETVWRIEYADQKVTVNGNDLSGMIPKKK